MARVWVYICPYVAPQHCWIQFLKKKKRQLEDGVISVGALTFAFILAHCRQIGAQIIVRGRTSRLTLLCWWYASPCLGVLKLLSPVSSACLCFLLGLLSPELSPPHPGTVICTQPQWPHSLLHSILPEKSDIRSSFGQVSFQGYI